MNDNITSQKEFQPVDHHNHCLFYTPSQTDQIVEILWFAYLRGLVIRQKQEEKSKTGNEPFPTDNRTVIKREGSPASEPRLNPSNRNGEEGQMSS